MSVAAPTAKGIGRSLRAYHAPGRAALLDGFHRRFLDPGDLAFDVGAHVGDRAASFRRLGARVVVRKIAVQKTEKRRLVEVDRKMITTDAESVIDDPSVDIVIELIGGDDPALGYMTRALDAKRHVVTANKLLLAKHGDAIFSLAEKQGVDVYYEAAV